MNALQDLKFTNITPPAAIVDNSAFATAIFDSKGIESVVFLVTLGATDIAATALKLTESDDSGMSGAVDVSGADFSVSPLTLPSATDDNGFYAIYVKCGGNRKRYFDLSFTAGNGTAGTFATVTAIAIPAIRPDTPTERGLVQQAIV